MDPSPNGNEENPKRRRTSCEIYFDEEFVFSDSEDETNFFRLSSDSSIEPSVGNKSVSRCEVQTFNTISDDLLRLCCGNCIKCQKLNSIINLSQQSHSISFGDKRDLDTNTFSLPANISTHDRQATAPNHIHKSNISIPNPQNLGPKHVKVNILSNIILNDDIGRNNEYNKQNEIVKDNFEKDNNNGANGLKNRRNLLASVSNKRNGERTIESLRIYNASSLSDNNNNNSDKRIINEDTLSTNRLEETVENVNEVNKEVPCSQRKRRSSESLSSSRLQTESMRTKKDSTTLSRGENIKEVNKEDPSSQRKRRSSESLSSSRLQPESTRTKKDSTTLSRGENVKQVNKEDPSSQRKRRSSESLSSSRLQPESARTKKESTTLNRGGKRRKLIVNFDNSKTTLHFTGTKSYKENSENDRNINNSSEVTSCQPTRKRVSTSSSLMESAAELLQLPKRGLITIEDYEPRRSCRQPKPLKKFSPDSYDFVSYNKRNGMGRNKLLYDLIDRRLFKLNIDTTNGRYFTRAFVRKLARRGGINLISELFVIQHENFRFNKTRKMRKLYTPDDWLTSKDFNRLCQDGC